MVSEPGRFERPFLSGVAGGGASGGAAGTIKVGFVSPRTGATAGFGEPDGYVFEELAALYRALGRPERASHYDALGASTR